MVDISSKTRCIKTGGQGYLVEEREYIYGDWFLANSGVLICDAVRRSPEKINSNTVHFEIAEVSFWNSSSGHAKGGTLIVDADCFYNLGYDGVPYTP